jgi:hypothetical protein
MLSRHLRERDQLKQGEAQLAQPSVCVCSWVFSHVPQVCRHVAAGYRHALGVFVHGFCINECVWRKPEDECM